MYCCLDLLRSPEQVLGSPPLFHDGFARDFFEGRPTGLALPRSPSEETTRRVQSLWRQLFQFSSVLIMCYLMWNMFEIMSTLFLHTEMALQSTERTAIISGKGSEFSLTPGFVNMMNVICWEMAFDLLCKVLQLRDLHLWPPVSPAKKGFCLIYG